MRLPLALFFGLALCAAAAQAAERIVDFRADIGIGGDGVLTVREDITVEAAGQQIKRGIYRDFPVRHRRADGSAQSTSFDVEAVLRDGRAEPYHLTSRGDYRRLYIGEAGRYLTPGIYRYTIVYTSRRQLAHFDDRDELYWNVTGDRWAFAIEQAEARVHLPPGAILLDRIAYTGPRGATEQAAVIETAADGSVLFRASRALAPGEGLTIALSWPPGHVVRPGALERAAQALGDNRQWLIALTGPLMVLGYFILVWWRVGRDPESGPLVVRYRPPKGLSPAACRFVREMGFDAKAMAAAIVSLAVKGALAIRDDADGYVLAREGSGVDAQSLSRGEKAVLDRLFPGNAETLAVKNSNHKTFVAARKALKRALRTEYELHYFHTNRWRLLVGAGLALAVIAALAATADSPATVLFMAVWLAGWGFGCYQLVARLRTQWQMARARRSAMYAIGGALATLFTLPFLAGLLFGFFLLGQALSLAALGALIALVLMVIGFYHWLKAPTRAGRRAMDAIDGFREFLGATEQHRLDLMNPPARTPALFETFLPYAIALDVETRWADQFAGVLKAAAAAPGERPYRPRWYRGRAGAAFSPSDFSTHMGSGLASALSGAATAPSRGRSGFSGGFSGGGGGGGGGGGW